jgi:hypothetical protein
LRARLVTYAEKTAPLIGYMPGRLLMTVRGRESKPLFEEIVKKLGG